MRIFNKKTLWCQIQDASLISAALSGLSMVGSSFLLDTSTPLVVSGTIMTISIISAIGSGRIEHKKESINEESIESELYQVYEIIPDAEFEEKKQRQLSQAIQNAYKKDGNLISVDFEQINELKKEGKKLVYKNRSN